MSGLSVRTGGTEPVPPDPPSSFRRRLISDGGFGGTGSVPPTFLRGGAWLTPWRIRLYGWTLIVLYVAIFTVAVATFHRGGSRQIGTDFSQVWIAGRSVLAGDAAAPFDITRHAAAQRQVFGPGADIYGWHYPPYFLAIAALCALLPYLPALFVWQASTLAFYGWTMWRILPYGPALVAAMAFPAAYVNLGHGHNGFLTAGLMGSAVLCLRARPLLAGALFALVAYKPQFGLVVPVALVAGGHWRTIAAAAAMLCAMTAASVAGFGLASWRAFSHGLEFTRVVVLEQGSTGWEKIQSAFAAVRMWGGAVTLAYAVSATVALCVLAGVAWLYRRGADWRPAGAALLSGALLTTPYCLDYDMMLLGPALGLLVSYRLERGFAPWEKTLLAVIWLSPMLARLVARHLDLPLGLAAIAGVFVLACVAGAGEVRPIRTARI